MNRQAKKQLQLRRCPARGERRERAFGKLGIVGRDRDMSGATGEALDDGHVTHARVDRLRRIVPLPLHHARAHAMPHRALRVVDTPSEARRQRAAEGRADRQQPLDHVEGLGLTLNAERVEMKSDTAIAAARRQHFGKRLRHRKRGRLDRDVGVESRRRRGIDR